MTPNPTRRDFILGSGSIAVGVLGSTLIGTEEASAVSIDSSTFSVPDKTKTVNNTVQTVKLTANGSFSLKTNETPTRIVVRLEASRGPSWTQIDATKLNVDTREFTLSGNLTDLETVGNADINPTERGQTKDIDLSARIILEVTKDGKTLGTDTVKDSFTVSITKEDAYATIGMDATGSLNVVTESQ